MFDTAPTLRMTGNALDAEGRGAEPAAAQVERARRAGTRTLVLHGDRVLADLAGTVELARGAHAAGLAVGVETDGRHLDGAAAAALRDAGVSRVWVELPTFVKAQHDLLVDREGAGATALTALAALHAAGLPTWLDVVVSSPTLRTFASTVRTALDRFGWIEGVRVAGVAPRGRMRDPALLPDLAALGPLLRRAHAEARSRSVQLVVRPGTLPACVGFEPGEPPAPPPPVEDTAYGAPCRDCALRPVCAGAWPAVWDVQGGRGLDAPERLVEPWDHAEPAPALQAVVRLGSHAHGGLDAARRALEGARAPTRWLWATHLDEAVVSLPFTHLALEVQGNALPASVLRLARRVGRPVHVGLRLPADPFELRPVAHLLDLAGVTTLALLAGEGWVAAELDLREATPNLDVRRVPPPPG